jgi:hypothetical protein
MPLLGTAMLLLGLASVAEVESPHDYYEWTAVAPVVVAANLVQDEGKHTRFRFEHVFRGSATPGSTAYVRVRQANRDRDREEVPRAVHLEAGRSYLLLLEPAAAHDGLPSFTLARGLGGVRELPAEGAPAVIEALDVLVEIQDHKDEAFTWTRFSEMLEGTNPVLLDTALQQFLKFRRGEVGQLPEVRVLLEHPAPATREKAAQLIGQVLAAEDPIPPEERTALRDELSARARRDADVRVRVAATTALDRLQTDGVDDILAEIADSDPDQGVRFAAERLIYERRRNGGPR